MSEIALGRKCINTLALLANDLTIMNNDSEKPEKRFPDFLAKATTWEKVNYRSLLELSNK